MKKILQKFLLLTVMFAAGVSAWGDDVVVNIPIAASYNICGANNASSQPITQLYISSAGGNYGEAQIKFVLDNDFDATKVKSASLQLYTISKSSRDENVIINSISGFNSNLNRKNCGDPKTTSEDGNAKVFQYGSNNTRSYGFAGSNNIANIALTNFTASATTNIDITSYIQNLTTNNPGDEIYFGISATDAKPLALQIAGYQHENASKLVITYTNDAIYNWSINAVCEGTTIKTFKTGNCTEGSTYSTSINKVVSDSNGNYYVLKDNQDGINGYTASYVMGGADATKEIEYTHDSSIEYFAEGELFYSSQASNWDICSGGRHTSYMQSTTGRTSTLSGGTYQMEVYITGRYGSNPLNVYDSEGNVEYATTGKGSSSFTGIKETGTFLVGPGGDVRVGLKGGNSLSFDYFIIRKVSDDFSLSVTTGANGYTTFASVYPLDLTDENRPDGLKAYSATRTGTTLSFTELHQTVPAGTGILLLGEAGTAYNINVAASGTDVASNDLIGVTTRTAYQSDASGNYYFAMKKASNADDPLTFLPITTANQVNVPAGKAIVEVPATEFGSSNAAIRVTFDDGQATGINSVQTEDFVKEGIYTLSGQRVNTLSKGFYIVNGKKVLVK